MDHPFAGKVILLNSPPNTGKDLAASILVNYSGAKHCEFKMTLHNIAMAITGLSRDEYFSIYNDRNLKEKPHPKLFGKSPREMMIWISEEVCKPEFGKYFFGKASANSLDIEKGSIFSDSGFSDEIYPLAEVVGASNIYVVRFTRNGATFENDSRDYLKEEDCPEGVNFIDLTNDGTIYDFTINIWDRVVG